MELIPAIDLLGGRVVRLRRGDYDQVIDYGSDPVAVAQRWVREGATRLHVVDLDGARQGAPTEAATIQTVVRSVLVPCQVAGGIRDERAVAATLDMGADRVVLGSALIADPSMAGRLVARHGAARIVAAIDVRDGQALGSGWVEGAVRMEALALVRSLADAGLRWFAVTAIARDGLLGGPDLDLLQRIQDTVPAASIICSGGVTTTAQVRQLADHGFAAAILGRALYEGALDFADAFVAARG